MADYVSSIISCCEVVYEVFPDAYSRLRAYGIVEIYDEHANLIATGADFEQAWANAAVVARMELDRREQEACHGNAAGAILCASVVGAAIWMLCGTVCFAFHVSPWALLLPGGAIALAASAAMWEARQHPQ